MAGDLVNLLDFSVHVPHFADTVVQGLADAAVCPAFGEPGWSLFCGNPAFEAFDAYQAFIENLVVSLHDSLKVSERLWCLHTQSQLFTELWVGQCVWSQHYSIYGVG